MKIISNGRSWARILAAGGAGIGLAAAVAVAAPGASAAEPYPTPAIAVAGGNSVIATQTSQDGLRFDWNQYGTSTWRGEPVAASGTTYSAPAIAQDGDSVIIAAEGYNNSLWFYWAVNGSSKWQPQTVAGPGTAYSAPAITGNQGYGNIAVEGPGHTLSFYWQKNGDLVWNLQVVPGEADYQTPAIIAATFDEDDEACIFVGPEMNCASNGGGSWGGVLGVGEFGGVGGSDSTVTVNNGSLNVAIFGATGQLDFFWQDDSERFHREEVAPASLF